MSDQLERNKQRILEHWDVLQVIPSQSLHADTMF